MAMSKTPRTILATAAPWGFEEVLAGGDEEGDEDGDVWTAVGGLLVVSMGVEAVRVAIAVVCVVDVRWDDDVVVLDERAAWFHVMAFGWEGS